MLPGKTSLKCHDGRGLSRNFKSIFCFFQSNICTPNRVLKCNRNHFMDPVASKIVLLPICLRERFVVWYFRQRIMIIQILRQNRWNKPQEELFETFQNATISMTACENGNQLLSFNFLFIISYLNGSSENIKKQPGENIQILPQTTLLISNLIRVSYRTTRL